MEDSELLNRITADPNVMVGKPVVKGTRITVEWVLDLLGGGWTNEQILDQFPHLSLPDIHACLVFAREAVRNERVYPSHTGSDAA